MYRFVFRHITEANRVESFLAPSLAYARRFFSPKSWATWECWDERACCWHITEGGEHVDGPRHVEVLQ